MKRSWVGLVLIGLGLSPMGMACSGPPDEASGQQIYEQVCSNCHGVDLEGGLGPAIGAGSNSAEQAEEFLTLTITRGRGRMPSFDATLTDEQVERLVEYVRSRQQ
jgi:mono/diheme cytochrome c family protein